MGIIELLPIISIIVETFKRFIPKSARKWANPILSMILGLGGAYATGGTENLLAGLGAAVGAIGVYKIPKEIGKKVIKE